MESSKEFLPLPFLLVFWVGLTELVYRGERERDGNTRRRDSVVLVKTERAVETPFMLS